MEWRYFATTTFRLKFRYKKVHTSNTMNTRLLFILPCILLLIFSCRKNSFITSSDARIRFSADTVFFDTVFTSTGSITQSVKIINGNNQKLNLSDVKLMGGSGSVFKINIDGSPVTEASNIEVEANDSIYLFVSVFINPNAANLPFVLQDSIQVSFNGNRQYIQLQAWGQNANFIRNGEISSNAIWTRELPYVILGGLQIDSNATLTIQHGSRIYLHADAPFMVDGTLMAQGDSNDRVYFTSDRLDVPYSGFPGSWPGIVFRGTSRDNLLQFAEIKNAYQGIVIVSPSVNSNPKLVLNESIIDNIYDAGISATQTSVEARNCLISNCGKNIVISYGGDYSFTNCTVASFGNDYIPHSNPVLAVSNTLSGDNTTTYMLTASFLNCIFWGDNGSVDDEVLVSDANNPTPVNFSNCLWKVKNFPVGVDTVHMLLNLNPQFDSVNNQIRFYDFHLKDGSPAIDFGQLVPNVPFDLDGKPRTIAGKPDLGCYEKQ